MKSDGLGLTRKEKRDVCVDMIDASISPRKDRCFGFDNTLNATVTNGNVYFSVKWDRGNK